MRKFIIFIVALVCFSPHSYAKTFIVDETSDFVEIQNDYATAEKKAYENVLEKIAEHFDIATEFIQKNEDDAYHSSIAVKVTATVQKILEKNYIYKDNAVACHIKAEVDEEKLKQALDKAKVTAQKELYHEMANQNEREKDAYKAQSVNPTSIQDKDYINLMKQAKQAFLQKRYSHCIQFAQQAENASLYAGDTRMHTTAMAYLALANAKIGNFYESMAIADRVLKVDPYSVYALHAQQLSNISLDNAVSAQEYSLRALQQFVGKDKSKFPLVTIEEIYFNACRSYIVGGNYEEAIKLATATPFYTGNKERDLNIQSITSWLSQKKTDGTINDKSFIFYFTKLHYNLNDENIRKRIRLQQFDSFYNQSLVHLFQGLCDKSVDGALKHYRIAYAITKQYPEEYEYQVISKDILQLLNNQYVKQYPNCIRFVTGEEKL